MTDWELQNAPDILCVDSSWGYRFYVCQKKEDYLRYVRQELIVFSWKEMNKILDCEPSQQQLEWALDLKLARPGVRIDDITKQQVTYPKA